MVSVAARRRLRCRRTATRWAQWHKVQLLNVAGQTVMTQDGLAVTTHQLELPPGLQDEGLVMEAGCCEVDWDSFCFVVPCDEAESTINHALPQQAPRKKLLEDALEAVESFLIQNLNVVDDPLEPSERILAAQIIATVCTISGQGSGMQLTEKEERDLEGIMPTCLQSVVEASTSAGMVTRHYCDAYDSDWRQSERIEEEFLALVSEEENNNEQAETSSTGAASMSELAGAKEDEVSNPSQDVKLSEQSQTQEVNEKDRIMDNTRNEPADCYSSGPAIVDQSAFKVGLRVRIQGLSTESGRGFNGRFGSIVSTRRDCDRVGVAIDDIAEVKWIKVSKLQRDRSLDYGTLRRVYGSQFIHLMESEIACSELAFLDALFEASGDVNEAKRQLQAL